MENLFYILAVLAIIAIPVFLVLSLVSLIKKNGKAKKFFKVSGISLIAMIAFIIIGSNIQTSKEEEKVKHDKAAALLKCKNDPKCNAKLVAKAKEETKKKAIAKAAHDKKVAEAKAKEEAAKKKEKEAEAKQALDELEYHKAFVDVDDYNRLQTGMSSQTVWKVIGNSKKQVNGCSKSNEMATSFNHITFFQCDSEDGAIVSIGFDGNELYSISQIGW